MRELKCPPVDGATERKIVQITSVEHPAGRMGPLLYALCDDGTVWFCYPEQKTLWSRVRSITDNSGEDR
jgi:hypothetical protein